MALGRTALALAGVTAAACGGGTRPPVPGAIPVTRAPADLVSERIRSELAPTEGTALWRLYAARDYRAAWVETAGRHRRALELLAAIERAGEDGLDPDRYGVATALERLAGVTEDPGALAALDILLSELALLWARDLALGRVAPEGLDPLWTSSNVFDPVAAVAAVDAGTVAELAERLRPPHAGYAALRQHLLQYRARPPDDSSAARIRQIAVNLERWRWLPRDLGARYVLVNSAAFEAVAVEDGSPVLRTRVVVGRPDWSTPIVSARIASVVVNPAWNVPGEIARREILAAVRADSGFLAHEGIRVYRAGRLVDPRTIAWASVSDTALPFQFVQAPGPGNPLGRVKMPLLSPFNVALHDTPQRALFERPERTASHGCLRVEHAMELAAWLLGPAGRPALDSALATSQERVLPLTDALPVHVVYWTAWVGPDGALHVERDVYGWDERLRVTVGARASR